MFSHYRCCAHAFSGVEYVLIVKRLPGSYTHNLIIPSFIVTMVTTLVFSLPHNICGRVFLVVEMMTSLLFMQMSIIQLTPENSDSTPLINKLFLSSMVVICSCMFCNVVALNMRGQTKAPRWIVTLVLKWIAPAVCFTYSPHPSVERGERDDSDVGSFVLVYRIKQANMKVFRAIECSGSLQQNLSIVCFSFCFPLVCCSSLSRCYCVLTINRKHKSAFLYDVRRNVI